MWCRPLHACLGWYYTTSEIHHTHATAQQSYFTIIPRYTYVQGKSTVYLSCVFMPKTHKKNHLQTDSIWHYCLAAPLFLKGVFSCLQQSILSPAECLRTTDRQVWLVKMSRFWGFFLQFSIEKAKQSIWLKSWPWDLKINKVIDKEPNFHYVKMLL